MLGHCDDWCDDSFDYNVGFSVFRKVMNLDCNEYVS